MVHRSLFQAVEESCGTLLPVLQVMNDEQGLQGCWFTGAVRRLHEGYALVQYADLQTPDEGAQLQEWFRIPGEVAGSLGAVQAEHEAHHSLSYKLRPAPPAQVSCWAQELQPAECSAICCSDSRPLLQFNAVQQQHMSLCSGPAVRQLLDAPMKADAQRTTGDAAA